GAEVDCRVQFLQFVVDLAGDGRVADVGVDLALAGDADAHRFELFAEVNLVGGDDHSAAGDLVTDEFGFEVFAPGDEAHGVGDDAGAGTFQLRRAGGSGHRKDSVERTWGRAGESGRRVGREARPIASRPAHYRGRSGGSALRPRRNAPRTPLA